MSREAPPPYQGDPGLWAEDLNDYLVRSKQVIGQLTSDDKATQDGIFLWDTTGYPVVSKDGEFRQIVLADGHGDFIAGSDVTFTGSAARDIPWTAAGTPHGISLSGNDIIFEEPGHYLATFSAQIYSTSASTVNFAFWSEINGSGAYTMRNALHQNGAALVVSRSAIFEVSANDALTARAFSDSSSGVLKAFAANNLGAGEPASPAATLSIVRVHQ